MNILHLITVLALLAFASLFIVTACAPRPRFLRGRRRVALANANLALQCRRENIRLKADTAIGRYLLVKYGSDPEHAALCGAAGIPLGNSDDAPGAAEDPFTVQVFGLVPTERIVIAAEAIAANVDVYTAANGKVQDLPAGAGTYYLVGRSSQSAEGDGDKLRIIPCFPTKLVVT
jgi:hypothetical protein